MPTRTIALIGAGRLSRALVPLLRARGFRVSGIWSRRPARVAGVAARTDLAAAVGRTPLVLLAVPDRAIAALARRLAALPGVNWAGRTVLHAAGALGPEPLRPLARAGAATGVIHPLQCLGRPDLASRVVAGSHARIEGAPRARAAARALARALGLYPLPGRPWTAADRGAYHAAAALVSNDLVALHAIAGELLQAAGISRPRAHAALVALSHGTLLHLEAGGIDAALTGPAVRGDRATLATHLARLAARSRQDAEVHRLLSRRLRRLARRSGPRRAPAL